MVTLLTMGTTLFISALNNYVVGFLTIQAVFVLGNLFRFVLSAKSSKNWALRQAVSLHSLQVKVGES